MKRWYIHLTDDKCDYGLQPVVLYTDAVKAQREAFVNGADWAVGRIQSDNPASWPSQEAAILYAARRYKEE